MATCCEYILDLTQFPMSKFIGASQKILQSGGSFSGNEASGTFEISTPLGRIKGNYTTSETQIYIYILSKPFLISCTRIEKELKAMVTV